MNNNEWMLYNKALIPATLPHITPNIDLKGLRKLIKEKRVLFARYTNNFDCGYETQWWYLIKDTPIHIDKLSSKQRYEINKGLRLCEVQIINPFKYAEELFRIFEDTVKSYPKSTRPNLNKEKFLNNSKRNSQNPNLVYFGCFYKETNQLIGYSTCIIDDTVVHLSSVKVLPDFLIKNVNAALAYTICVHFLNNLKYSYICDGERNISHDTNYQKFLIKLLNFRKAYCRLNVVYSKSIWLIVQILYIFRKLIEKIDHKIPQNVYSVLFQEEVRKSFYKK